VLILRNCGIFSPRRKPLVRDRRVRHAAPNRLFHGELIVVTNPRPIMVKVDACADGSEP
jgi:hypothetical protein